MVIIKRDENHVTVGAGVSSSDSVTPLMLRVDPTTGYLLLNVSNDSITATSATTNKRDENHVPTVYGISSDDGVTLVPIRTDTNGKLLIQFD